MIRSLPPRLVTCVLLVCLFLRGPIVAPVFASEPITPIPAAIDYDIAKAQLGRTLFHDPILSRDRTVSCASCHDLDRYGIDGRPVSTGVEGQQGGMNAPTVFNAVFNFKQFWNGRADSLAEQADGPIHNPVEMGMTAAEVERRLNGEASYRQAFRQVYGRKRIEYAAVLEAISEFEEALITPDSRFDRRLRGEIELNAAEEKGYFTFKELGCITCHNGVNVGGNSFQKLGVINPLPRDVDCGDRFTVTSEEADKNVYKVPTLRNIVGTAPYFHNGSIPTLKGALAAMAFHNLGLKLTGQEETVLLAFLNTLTGRRPEILTAASSPMPLDPE